MMRISLLFILLYSYSLTKPLHPNKNRIDTSTPNIIQINPNFNGYTEYTNHIFHIYHPEESHTKDGSGSVELVSHHWRKALTSPAFKCEKNQEYIFSAYMKVSKFPKGQNVTFGIIPRSNVQSSENYWNNSKENEWEEVLFPFIATKSGKCYFRIFTYTRAFNTDDKPIKVYQAGMNLNRTSKVYIDDIKIVKSKYIKSRQTPSIKHAFTSSFIKVDSLGNFKVKKNNNQWEYIFPKMIYRSKQHQWKKYAEYGFNGIMDIWRKEEVEFGLKQGLEYFAMATQPKDKLEGTLSKRIKNIIHYTYKINKPYSLLMYMYDNENEHIQDNAYKHQLATFINKNDKDKKTGLRARPIYYLNGQFGLTRSYKNKHIDVMDITGSYVGASYLPESFQLPKKTLDIINNTHNQIAPAPIIQLQSYLDNKFIPSLFYGIIQGGKGLSVWRDGGSQGNFQDRPWALAIKDTFIKIDKMLPIIQEPLWTPWSVSTQSNPYINIGTREHLGNAYIILSNHADEDQNITLTLNGIQAKYVKDYFTNTKISKISNKQFTLKLEHGNNGYKVLQLIK